MILGSVMVRRLDHGSVSSCRITAVRCGLTMHDLTCPCSVNSRMTGSATDSDFHCLACLQRTTSKWWLSSSSTILITLVDIIIKKKKRRKMASINTVSKCGWSINVDPTNVRSTAGLKLLFVVTGKFNCAEFLSLSLGLGNWVRIPYYFCNSRTLPGSCIELDPIRNMYLGVPIGTRQLYFNIYCLINNQIKT